MRQALGSAGGLFACGCTTRAPDGGALLSVRHRLGRRGDDLLCLVGLGEGLSSCSSSGTTPLPRCAGLGLSLVKHLSAVHHWGWGPGLASGTEDLIRRRERGGGRCRTTAARLVPGPTASRIPALLDGAGLEWPAVLGKPRVGEHTAGTAVWRSRDGRRRAPSPAATFPAGSANPAIELYRSAVQPAQPSAQGVRRSHVYRTPHRLPLAACLSLAELLSFLRHRSRLLRGHLAGSLPIPPTTQHASPQCQSRSCSDRVSACASSICHHGGGSPSSWAGGTSACGPTRSRSRTGSGETKTGRAARSSIRPTV